MEHVFSRAAKGRARAWRTARTLGIVSALVLAAAARATSDDGLPPGGNALDGVTISTGIAEAAPSRQWLRVPQTSLWVDAVNIPGTQIAIISAFAISPPGSPHPYGYFPPMTVRTLAFGLIPAEATLSISQLRQKVDDVDPDQTAPDRDGSSKEDVPVPWMLKGLLNTPGDHTLLGDADVRIASLSLDGVKVAVGPHCHSKTPAHVTLRGINGYTPTAGGHMAGAIDVPAFTGCGTNGEDLNALITSMVAGSGNSMEIAQSQLDIGGRGTPENIPSPFPLPER